MTMDSIFVDPAINANSGAGTVGDPYGDLEWAISNETLGTWGSLFNIKQGTAEVLSAPLDFTVFGVPSSLKPVAFQGYSLVERDRGIGAIDCNNDTMFASAAYDYITLADLEIFNGPNNGYLVNIDNNLFMVFCELHTSDKAVHYDAGQIRHCKIHGITGSPVNMDGGSEFIQNYIEVIGNGNAAVAIANGGFIQGNIVVCGANSIGLYPGRFSHCLDNIVYCTGAGTRQGIRFANYMNECSFANNIVSGFNGVGGIGIQFTVSPAWTGSTDMNLYGYNYVYNCSTAFDTALMTPLVDLGNNITLGSDPFVDAAGGDFSLTSAMKALGWPTQFYEYATTKTYIDPGAVQRKEPEGSIFVHPGMLGGIRG